MLVYTENSGKTSQLNIFFGLYSMLSLCCLLIADSSTVAWGSGEKNPFLNVTDYIKSMLVFFLGRMKILSIKQAIHCSMVHGFLERSKMMKMVICYILSWWWKWYWISQAVINPFNLLCAAQTHSLNSSTSS